MIERFLKKVVRKAVRVAMDWSNEETPTGPHDGWALPYTLNPVFVEVSRTQGCDHPYTWGVVHATNLAKMLGIPRVSIIEFGVAGGRSLLTLESIGTKVESIFGVKIDLYGFDTGKGLSKPPDCADMPNLWSEGAFPMEVYKLRARLRRSQLVLGPVNETVPEFIKTDIAPIAFAAFDVDLYSSTLHALKNIRRPAAGDVASSLLPV